MRDFVENEVGSLRDHGAPGISWALLVLCFALAFSPAPQPAGDRAASLFGCYHHTRDGGPPQRRDRQENRPPD